MSDVEATPVAGGGSCEQRSAPHDGVARGGRALVSLIEDLPEPFVLYDEQGRSVYANKEFRRRMGRSLGELVGRRPFEWDDGHFADSAEVTRFRALLDETLATGEPRDFTRSQPGLDGAQQTYRVSFRSQRDARGRVVGAFMFAQDVSDLDEAQRRVAQQEHEFRVLTESLPDVVVRFDLDGRAIYANHRSGTGEDGTPNSVLGLRPREIDDPTLHDKAEYDAKLMEVLRTGEPDQITLTFDRPQGRAVHSLLIRAERDADGAVCGAFVIGRDVTELVDARDEIARREREFRTLAENLPDVVLRYDRRGSLLYVNDAYEREFARERPALGTRAVVVHGLDETQATEFERRLLAVLDAGVPDRMELRLDRGAAANRCGCDDGDATRCYSITLSPERDDAGLVTGALALARDVTPLVITSQRAEESERRFRSLAENAKEFIGRWAPDGRRLYANPELARVTGASHDGLAGHPNHEGARGEFSDVVEAVMRCAREAAPSTILHTHLDPVDRSHRVHEVQLVPEFDDAGHVVSVLGVGRDVTTVVSQRVELERASRTDSLTGASNRRVFYEELPRAVAEASAHGRRIALVLADLDGFKHLNDQYGHTFGDRLLRATAEALSRCTDRPVIRLGGDEFVIIADVDSPTDAAFIAHDIQVILGDLRSDSERFPPIDVSFGVSLSPHDGTDPDVLLAAADLALYAAKHQGRGRVEFYRPELRAASERRSAIEEALRSAEPDEEMEVHLQPICALDGSGRVWGAEALLRWRHPVLGAVSPVEFIPIAEQCGQIAPIGRWVLTRAAALAAELNAGATDPLGVCVNVSTRQFTLDDVVDAVWDAIRTTGCDPRWLSLEITESLLLEDLPVVHDAIGRLRALGVHIAIDDFGTGYSALHYLTKLRIDRMKIDKSFVRDVESDAQQQEIVRALIALADAIGVDVIAEGIETEGQATFLRHLGCGLGQGFLFAPPLPYHELTRWLARAADPV